MSARKNKPNINLIIKEQYNLSFSSQLINWIFTYGRYIIIVTQIIVLTVFFTRFRLDREHADLKESLSQKKAIVESISDFEIEAKKIQLRLNNIEKILSSQRITPNILNFLEKNTPSDTIYSSLNITQDQIILFASSGSLRSFSYLLSMLQQSDKLTEVLLQDVIRNTNGKIEFTITGKINPKGFTGDDI